MEYIRLEGFAKSNVEKVKIESFTYRNCRVQLTLESSARDNATRTQICEINSITA